MISEKYVNSVYDVAEYLLQHIDEAISDDDIYQITPSYSKRIIDELIDNDVIASTADGILFSQDDTPALFSYLSALNDTLESESLDKIDIYLNRLATITNIAANISTTARNIIGKD